MTKVHDNKFPYITVAETAIPALPSAGDQKLFIDPADHKLKMVDSSGTVVEIGSGGGIALLDEKVASGSASLDFTSVITTDYDLYELVLFNIIPATSGELRAKVSTDNGATWLASTGYRYSSQGGNSAGGTYGRNSETAAFWLLMDGIINTASAGGWCGTYRLFSPNAGASNPSCMLIGTGYGLTTDSSHDYSSRITGRHTSTTPINALQIIMGAGNITSGKARLYGLAKP